MVAVVIRCPALLKTPDVVSVEELSVPVQCWRSLRKTLWIWHALLTVRVHGILHLLAHGIGIYLLHLGLGIGVLHLHRVHLNTVRYGEGTLKKSRDLPAGLAFLDSDPDP